MILWYVKLWKHSKKPNQNLTVTSFWNQNLYLRYFSWLNCHYFSNNFTVGSQHSFIHILTTESRFEADDRKV